jgi:hypothetical protein
MFHRYSIPLAEGAAHVIDILVVKNREKPSTQIGSGLPKMLFGDRADQGVLHEIVGSRRVPDQCAGIAPQPRNFDPEQISKVGHRVAYRSSSRGRAEAARLGQYRFSL